MGLRQVIRQVVPFSVRVAIVRARRMRAWRNESPQFLHEKSEAAEYPFVLTEHRSPLRRAGTTYAEDLLRGKETNVALAASIIDGTVVSPSAIFSYHHAVGPSTRKRGFVKGAELQDGELNPGIGGGCCQVSNLLYVLALLSGGQILERHRHGLDLFPDSGRTVPFGCGATVFFPMRDLRFRNELDQAMRIGLTLEDGYLVGRIYTKQPSTTRFEIFEMESHMRQEGRVWIRENRVGRRRSTDDGQSIVEEVAHNLARCMYDPEISQGESAAS